MVTIERVTAAEAAAAARESARRNGCTCDPEVTFEDLDGRLVEDPEEDLAGHCFVANMYHDDLCVLLARAEGRSR